MGGYKKHVVVGKGHVGRQIENYMEFVGTSNLESSPTTSKSPDRHVTDKPTN